MNNCLFLFLSPPLIPSQGQCLNGGIVRRKYQTIILFYFIRVNDVVNVRWTNKRKFDYKS